MDHLPAREALEFLKRNPEALFIDCRSEMEYLFVGHPVGVFNVLHGFEGELDEAHHRNTRAGWRYEGQPWEQC